jgi:hypothetical protein
VFKFKTCRGERLLERLEHGDRDEWLDASPIVERERRKALLTQAEFAVGVGVQTESVEAW